MKKYIVLLLLLFNIGVYGQDAVDHGKELTGIDLNESFEKVKQRLMKDAKPYTFPQYYNEKYFYDYGDILSIYESVKNPATGN